VTSVNSGFGSVQAVSLRDQVRNLLRTKILLGEIAPGEIQSVRTIADACGVSITPAREAVMDLAKDGMVEVVRNRGFRVPILGDEELDVIYETRDILESEAIARVAERIEVTALAEFRTMADAVTDSCRAGRLEDFIGLDRKFHLALLATLGNHRIVKIAGQLRDEARMIGMKVADQHLLVKSAEEHVAILDALQARDGDLARRLMREHLRHSRGIWVGRPEAVPHP
jgi:DNA-binding GntR family transcriptional regulator